MGAGTKQLQYTHIVVLHTTFAVQSDVLVPIHPQSITHTERSVPIAVPTEMDE